MENSKSPTPARNRGLFGYLLDRIVSWLLGLPPERSTYTTRGVRIPASEGLSRIELAADLLQPVDTEPAETILVRAPYGRGPLIGMMARAFAARGYQVLFVSTRGTFGSGGSFDPFRTEAEDGRGVVDWMRRQEWYTGTFATYGGSYLGFVQWALLCDPPDDMVAAVPLAGPHDFGRTHWESGALNTEIVRWANNISHQEEAGFHWEALTASRKLRPVIDGIPLAQSIRAYYGDRIPWLDNFVTNSDQSNPYYTAMNLDRALERANLPVLIVTGWYDLFLGQTMEQYARLKERGCNAKRKSAVQYFVSGAEEWRNIPEYPPSTVPYVLHLQDGGRLGSKPSSNGSVTSSFTFDPLNPTPSIGSNMLEGGGSVDDSALATRSDVLLFDTEPLEKDVEFCGKLMVELAHSTDIPYADLFVRISEVDERGKSRNITETFKRLDPKRGSDEVMRLALNDCAHRFVQGKRIRLLVGGGSFPHYARNIGTENSDNRGSEVRVVEHTIHHDGSQLSKVALPVIAIAPA